MDAIHNLDSEYTMVGLVEEMDTSYALLEKLLPLFFRGITNVPKRKKENNLKKY